MISHRFFVGRNPRSVKANPAIRGIHRAQLRQVRSALLRIQGKGNVVITMDADLQIAHEPELTE